MGRAGIQGRILRTIGTMDEESPGSMEESHSGKLMVIILTNDFS